MVGPQESVYWMGTCINELPRNSRGESRKISRHYDSILDKMKWGKKCPGELLYWRFNMLMFVTPILPKVSYSQWMKQQNGIKLAQLEEVCLHVKSWMLSPGNGWSCNMRILIFSVGEKMNLNQKTPRVDKRRSGLEGGSGYIISTDQEG